MCYEEHVSAPNITPAEFNSEYMMSSNCVQTFPSSSPLHLLLISHVEEVELYNIVLSHGDF